MAPGVITDIAGNNHTGIPESSYYFESNYTCSSVCEGVSSTGEGGISVHNFTRKLLDVSWNSSSVTSECKHQIKTHHTSTNANWSMAQAIVDNMLDTCLQTNNCAPLQNLSECKTNVEFPRYLLFRQFLPPGTTHAPGDPPDYLLPVGVWNFNNRYHSVTQSHQETVPLDVYATFDKVDWTSLFKISGVPYTRSHFEWSANRYYKQCQSCPWPNDFIANADIKGDIYEQALEDFTTPNAWLLKEDVNTTKWNLDWDIYSNDLDKAYLHFSSIANVLGVPMVYGYDECFSQTSSANCIKFSDCFQDASKLVKCIDKTILHVNQTQGLYTCVQTVPTNRWPTSIDNTICDSDPDLCLADKSLKGNVSKVCEFKTLVEWSRYATKVVATKTPTSAPTGEPTSEASGLDSGDEDSGGDSGDEDSGDDSGDEDSGSGSGDEDSGSGFDEGYDTTIAAPTPGCKDLKDKYRAQRCCTKAPTTTAAPQVSLSRLHTLGMTNGTYLNKHPKLYATAGLLHQFAANLVENRLENTTLTNMLITKLDGMLLNMTNPDMRDSWLFQLLKNRNEVVRILRPTHADWANSIQGLYVMPTSMPLRALDTEEPYTSQDLLGNLAQTPVILRTVHDAWGKNNETSYRLVDSQRDTIRSINVLKSHWNVIAYWDNVKVGFEQRALETNKTYTFIWEDSRGDGMTSSGDPQTGISLTDIRDNITYVKPPMSPWDKFCKLEFTFTTGKNGTIVDHWSADQGGNCNNNQTGPQRLNSTQYNGSPEQNIQRGTTWLTSPPVDNLYVNPNALTSPGPMNWGIAGYHLSDSVYRGKMNKGAIPWYQFQHGNSSNSTPPAPMSSNGTTMSSHGTIVITKRPSDDSISVRHTTA